ncbi:hypothetical protein P872_25210 [Rhodonellum psychrophilum GCM71 = DSM 17998]|uniref:PNPLA domain-containing protein n=2 Tax=Rhodonellum TaxID=336827 RepID=U5C335_9BACT|nr:MULTISPECIES: patatin-like phospholipase family protein [Rhodonellum]ERM84458.1 hypothetical protein P872_25210 [Rhodonellum psychrophilum GCM71 = DSM 17998]SDZ00600.1 Patatin-like phospholipase [Rhodonellum ikkaensis]
MWFKIFYSFPVQLLLLHLRKDLLLILPWALLTLIVIQKFGTVLGIPYLMLDPEYLNSVSWKGFFLVGIGLGIFTMSFHMTTYILHGAKFKFLAVVPRPFIQYTINNFIIPLLFYVLYLYCFIDFQLDNAPESNWHVFQYFLGFAGGTLLTFSLIFLYFGITNKNFFVLFADSLEKQLRKTKIPRAHMLRQIKDSKKIQDKVENYLCYDFTVREVRKDLSRFQGQQLLRVFDQNHLNLFIIQTTLIGVILFLGFFRENTFLQIPAAASGILLFSVMTMLVGALVFWLREWSIPVVILGALVINFLSNSDLFNRPHTAFGLNYDTIPTTYNLNHLNELLHPDTVKKDREYTIQILDNWRKKFPENQKPKMVMLTTSGGGQRAALWTLKVLQKLEETTNGELFNHTQLITGASGGIIGAAFFRELYLLSKEDDSIDILDPIYLDQMSSDNLNPIIFTLLVNDLLIRNQYFEYNGRRYLKDRGYAFENQLNINTKGILEKPISAYLEPEYKSQIPMMLITPLIINDGRKLIISPQSMSYMGVSHLPEREGSEKSQSIDFQRFFYDQDALNLRFISALRMGATFPFFTPNIQLPSIPTMETMDAGLSDNFGIQDALRFMYVFEDWIKENTSGVTMISIRDSEKAKEIDPKLNPTIIQKIFTPLKNIYINWDKVQTINNETLYNYLRETLDFELNRVEFEYSTIPFLKQSKPVESSTDVSLKDYESQRASLNWRLTAKEKKTILDNINSSKNTISLQKIKEIKWLVPKE